MNDRERLIACVTDDEVDRPPFWLFWEPWSRTWERWAHEGKPVHLDNMAAVRAHFGADQPPLSLPVNCGPCPRLGPTVLEQDADYTVYRDSWGIVRRDYRHGESMSDFLDFPVKTRDDWERFRAAYLNPDHPNRLEGNWRELGAAWMAQGLPIQLGYFPDVGLFGTVRWLLGDESGLLAFCTMPDLVHEIMDHMTTIHLTVFEQVVREVRVDVIHIWEDMCYRNGPLISPQHWEVFLGPHYRRIAAFAKAHGIPILSVDTDGDPALIASPMVQAGVNLLFPMEVAAGCDVNAWREVYPTLALLGGIDKRALALGPDAIHAELARIRPALEKGRYIPALDHLVPDDVPWENYRTYAWGLKELIASMER